ncbi:hypothetical protein HS088_TW22G01468 [Tripterygium wilfordii]|uniref:Secreted protein n=1 Tax=Tripterygium wilfordii TaxID=458696 RepID=A0A7J7C0Y5_TRIWF|nr:hypothetical protein HS088_TW22G01468 [Tripterygium wilfordii]
MGFFIFCLKFSRWWAALVPVSVPCAVETINYEHNNKIVVIHNSICFSGSTFFFFLLAVKPDQTPLTIPLSSLRLSASGIPTSLISHLSIYTDTYLGIHVCPYVYDVGLFSNFQIFGCKFSLFIRGASVLHHGDRSFNNLNQKGQSFFFISFASTHDMLFNIQF